MASVVTRKNTVVQDPPFAQFLFSDTRMAVVWLVLRLYLGYQWINASLHKLESPAWMQTGEALKAYWVKAVTAPPGGSAPVVFGWYASFLKALINGGHYVWFAKLVAVGEAAIGLALIVGAFVGIAAFFGAFMNWNFIMAGSASTNGFLFAIAVLLILAWKVAGWYGLDRYLLPILGTPWNRSAAAPAPPQPQTAEA